MAFPRSWPELPAYPGEPRTQHITIELQKTAAAADVLTSRWTDEELKTGNREDLPDGRVWGHVVKPDKRVQAVIGVAVKAGEVVRCNIDLGSERADWLPTARKVCESIRVTAK